jgi:PAS domain-containing protein
MFWYAGMIVFLIVLLLIGPVFLFRGVCIRLFSKLKYKSLRLFGVAIASRTISSLLASLDAMFTINSEGRIVDFSPAAERLFGYSRDAVQTRRLTDFLKLPEALQARRFGDLAGLLENSESVVLNRRFEAFGFHRDGSAYREF